MSERRSSRAPRVTAASGPSAPERAGGGAGAKPPGGRPDYTVYRARPGLLSRLRPRDRFRLPRPGSGGTRGGGFTWKRAGKIALALAAGWIVLSVILFFVSAQLSNDVPERTEQALSDGGSLLTGSNILVLGSDERPKRIREQLAAQGEDPGEGGRADSILLLHVGFGTVRRLSILRDSLTEVPNHGVQRINAAYFLGGPPLMVRTVESFMGNGLEINHIIEVDFRRFPDLIDALGGVDVTVENRICAEGFDLAGEGVQLDRGEHHLSGEEALSFARVRENSCAPEEDDRARAARQQQVLDAIRGQALSPSTFLRLPWVSWEAPRAIRTDLEGPGLSMLFFDLLTGGTGETNVLEPTLVNSDGSVEVSEEARADAVDELLGGE